MVVSATKGSAANGRSYLAFLITVLAEHLRLNYLHLMSKAAEAEDRQSYFHYLKLAEKALRNGKERDGIWQPTRA